MMPYKELTVKEKKVSYNIKEKNGVIITTCIIQAIVSIYNNFMAKDEIITTIGQAFCNPKDTFNETIGAKIAYNRALINLNGEMKQRINKEFTKKQASNLADYHEQMSKLIKKYGSARDNLNYTINKLVP